MKVRKANVIVKVVCFSCGKSSPVEIQFDCGNEKTFFARPLCKCGREVEMSVDQIVVTDSTSE